MLSREEALESVRTNVENENLIRHMLATEAVMRALAERLGENVVEWGLTGLLHDIDMELTGGDMQTHSLLGADIVRDLGAGDAVAQAVLAHNAAHNVLPGSTLDRALFCADPLTGLITAAALVRPDKKLAGVTVKSVLKRYKEKAFAASVSREQIARCTDIGLELSEFVSLGLAAMQGIADDLGL